MTATAKKQKPLKRHPSKLKKMSAYMILTLILISIVAVLFAFPLYWIITGSFKTGAAINSTTPEWWPSQWVLTKFMAYLGDYYQITPGWATARTEWWNMLQRVGTGEDVATSVATFVQNANAAAAAEA